MKRQLRSLTALALVLGLFLLPVSPASAGRRIAGDGELLEELAKMREMNAVGFQLSLKKSYFAKLSENSLEGLSVLFLSAGMTDYSLRCTVDGDLTLDDVKWTEPHTASCSTEEGFRESLRDLLSQRVPSCQIIVTDEAVFSRLASGKTVFLYSALYGAEEVSVRTTLHAPFAFYFSDIRYFEDPWFVVSGEDAWRAVVREMAEKNADAFYLIPDPAFSEKATGDGELLKRLETAGAVFEYEYTFSDDRLIKVRVTARYPGTRIVNALREDSLLSLNHRERETLAAARELADACRRDDPLETARLVHDALCERIRYTNDEAGDEDDNAIGALLSGRANCDGYADAFYLTGTLAGLEVRYQYGSSRRREMGGDRVDESHMWNLVRIGGSWRMTDVTWDDQESRTVHTWFCIGADRARRTHVWDEENSPPLEEKTDPAGRPGNEYLIRNKEEIRSAVSDADARGYAFFTLILDDGCPLDSSGVLDCLIRAANRPFSYSWNEYMRAMTVSRRQ